MRKFLGKDCQGDLPTFDNRFSSVTRVVENEKSSSKNLIKYLKKNKSHAILNLFVAPKAIPSKKLCAESPNKVIQPTVLIALIPSIVFLFLKAH